MQTCTTYFTLVRSDKPVAKMAARSTYSTDAKHTTQEKNSLGLSDAKSINGSLRYCTIGSEFKGCKDAY